MASPTGESRYALPSGVQHRFIRKFQAAFNLDIILEHRPFDAFAIRIPIGLNENPMPRVSISITVPVVFIEPSTMFSLRAKKVKESQRKSNNTLGWFEFGRNPLCNADAWVSHLGPSDIRLEISPQASEPWIHWTKDSRNIGKASTLRVEHSQTINTRHPLEINAQIALRSRSTLPASLVLQNSGRDAGNFAYLQWACICQKQPWTKIATFLSGRTTSGAPGRSFR
jgi:hypothetical protein